MIWLGLGGRRISDQFKTINPVQSHFGMKLLQRMGWNPGEGLGKNRTGSVEPLQLDFKNDKKGLFAACEGPPSKSSTSLAHGLSGKHPVTALVELCTKRGWNRPEFEVVYDHGPVHKKNYLLKAIVNNEEFKPAVGSSSKKVARANAAAVALQALGLIPSTLPEQSVAARSTSLNSTNDPNGAATNKGSKNPKPFPTPRKAVHMPMQVFTKSDQNTYQMFDEYGNVFYSPDGTIIPMDDSTQYQQQFQQQFPQEMQQTPRVQQFPGEIQQVQPHQYPSQQHVLPDNEHVPMFPGGPIVPAPPPPPPNSDLPPPPPPGDEEPATPPPADQLNGANSNDPHSTLAAQAAMYAAASNAFYAKGSSYGYGVVPSCEVGDQSQQYYGSGYSG